MTHLQARGGDTGDTSTDAENHPLVPSVSPSGAWEGDIDDMSELLDASQRLAEHYREKMVQVMVEVVQLRAVADGLLSPKLRWAYTRDPYVKQLVDQARKCRTGG